MSKTATEIGKFAILMGIILAVGFLASNFIGLSRTGFESSEILGLQTFYIVGVAFALGLFSLKIYAVSSRKGDETYGSSIGFASLGEKPHIPFFKRFTQLQIFFLSMIIFGLFAFVNIVFLSQLTGQTSYTSVGVLEAQQFTATDSVIYSSLLVPVAENLGVAFLIALIMVTLGILARKQKIDAQSYKIILIASVILLAGFFGLGNHFLRYQGFEISLITVFLFWAIGGLFTILSGSFIPFWVLHIMNNLFLDLSRFFSNEATIIFSFVLIAVSGALYFLIYKGNLRGARKNEFQ